MLAQINNLHVIIKRLSADGTCYETIREYPAEDAPVFVMLHTMAGTKNGFHPSGGQALNHFNLLSMHRGILVSPTITYSHVHNVMKSKSTSIGAQVSPKSAIPGSASFGHDKKNKQSDTLATISSNIHQVTNSDTSGINQDVEKMTREGKNTGTHVNIHAPAIPLGTVGELWNQAKTNAGIVANRVLGIPVETVVPQTQERKELKEKEEPNDTFITDAEADAIMDDLEVQGKKQEADRKAQERKAAEKAAAEKKETTESIFYPPIKTETDWTVSILDTESRGRPQERIVTRETNTQRKKISPTKLDDTYIEKGSSAFNGGIEDCFESREKFYQGENSLKTVAQALVAQNFDNLAQLPQLADKLTFGLFSKAGELFDHVPAALGTGVRQGVRDATGDQALGQNAGAIVYGLAGFISPKSYMAPVQIAAKLVPVNKLAVAAKVIEGVNLGKAVNAESKVLQGLDLAEGNLLPKAKKNPQPWIIREGQEWKEKIYGIAQKTKTDGHQFRAYRQAIEEAKDPNIVRVHLDHGYNRATGEKIKSNRRPDVLTVDKSGKVNAYEVPSKSDKPKELIRRNQEAMAKLPEERRGNIELINITDGGAKK